MDVRVYWKRRHPKCERHDHRGRLRANAGQCHQPPSRIFQLPLAQEIDAQLAALCINGAQYRLDANRLLIGHAAVMYRRGNLSIRCDHDGMPRRNRLAQAIKRTLCIQVRGVLRQHREDQLIKRTITRHLFKHAIATGKPRDNRPGCKPPITVHRHRTKPANYPPYPASSCQSLLIPHRSTLRSYTGRDAIRMAEYPRAGDECSRTRNGRQADGVRIDAAVYGQLRRAVTQPLVYL